MDPKKVIILYRAVHLLC